jgi:putative colanic acid biosynthesis acetyltransferase WcaF
MEALEPDSRQEAHKEVRLDLFPKRLGLDRGRPYWVEVAWYLTKMLFFVNPIPYPHSFRKRLLVLFGAKVGAGLS